MRSKLSYFLMGQAGGSNDINRVDATEKQAHMGWAVSLRESYMALPSCAVSARKSHPPLLCCEPVLDYYRGQTGIHHSLATHLCFPMPKLHSRRWAESSDLIRSTPSMKGGLCRVLLLYGVPENPIAKPSQVFQNGTMRILFLCRDSCHLSVKEGYITFRESAWRAGPAAARVAFQLFHHVCRPLNLFPCSNCDNDFSSF